MAPKRKQQLITRLKPVPYTINDLRTSLKTPHLHVRQEHPEIKETFYDTDDTPYNKRGFKYTACRPNPYFSSIMYSTSDILPHNVRLSYFDRSPGMLINKSLSRATAMQGWRSARTNVGIRNGKWYVEYKIIKANHDDNSHVRFGIARKEASLEAPVGFDGYGYGFRDLGGMKVHLSKPVEFLKGEEFKTGDVVGLLVELPNKDVQIELSKKMINRETLTDPGNDETTDRNTEGTFIDVGCIRDQIPIKYKNQLFFEQYEYTPSKAMEHLLNPVTVFGEKAIPDKQRFKPARLPESKITLYKNGIKKGVAFDGLFSYLPPSSEEKSNLSKSKKQAKFNVSKDDGSLGYYPMVSCYKGGIIEINGSHKLEIIPENLKDDLETRQIKIFSERFHETVVEDYVFDLIDEIINEYLDKREMELIIVRNSKQ